VSESEHIAPVPPECDLRGLPWMPIDTVRLLDSDLNAIAKPEEFRAAVRLWCKAWHQVPASSLPDDDRILATLSGTGARWKKLREVALRGFVKCTDGRLYHPVIAEKALEAWAHRKAQRDRAAKRWQLPGISQGNAAASAKGSAAAMQGTGTGQDKNKTEEPIAPSASPLAAGPNGHDQLADPVVERIPLCDKTEFEVKQSFVAELDRLYPAVGPVQTLREIRGWCIGNPTRTKTKRGVKAFITSWFAREQDKQSRRVT